MLGAISTLVADVKFVVNFLVDRDPNGVLRFEKSILQ